MRHKREKPRARRWATYACLAVLLVSGTLLTRDLLRARRERAANEALAQQVEEARQAARPAAETAEPAPETAEETAGALDGYAALWEQNHDLAGWLTIPDTGIDYPVMYTPEEPEYYLRRAFDGSYAVSGCIFIGEGCGPDTMHTILYGHNMRDGSMFGGLKAYAKEDYAKEHPAIRFDTLTEEREYELVAAFYSKVYTDQDEGVFRYYQYSDLSGQESYEAYVEQAKAASLYDTGMVPEYGQRLLTLSTCSSYMTDGRFVVVAVEKTQVK